MSAVAAFRQRLPCAGLFFCAAVGVVVGRYAEAPGWTFAAGAIVALALAIIRPLPGTLALATALVFATAQSWSYRESSAVRLAAKLAPSPQACEVTFTVLEAPRVSETSGNSRFPARLEALTIQGHEIPANCRVIVYWHGPPPLYGAQYRARASIVNCPPQRNPGTFDYTAWLANEGIRSQIEIRHPRDAALQRTGGSAIVRLAIASRAWIERTITLGIEGTPEATLIKGMTIGDISDAPGSLKDAFRETGTFHLFSVSGLHVAIVAGLIWSALAILGLSQRRAVIVLIPCLFFYALLTGLSAASVRAAVMLSVLAAGLLLDRPASILNSLGAAGLILLLWDSSQLFNPGFQLSFGAVVVIALIAAPLHRRLGALGAPDPLLPSRLIPRWKRALLSLWKGASLLISVSLAAWLATLPLVLFYFHLVPLLSIPANLLAVPISTGILALSAVSLLGGAISPWLASVFNNANFLLSKIVLSCIQGMAVLPGSSFYVGLPQPPGALGTIVVLDAGRGGATAIFSGGRVWLVDTGSSSFAAMTTLPFLRTSGVDRLDTLVLTHGDSQHIGGFDIIAPALRPGQILDSGLADRSPTRERITSSADLRTANAGALFPIGRLATAEVLYPPAGLQASRADDKALVLRIELGDFSALLLSDSGIETEMWLLAHAKSRLPCDLVVMGRHHSGLSGDSDFLRAAAPRAIIASVASFPDSELLRPLWATTLERAGIALLRQDKTGAVTVTVRDDSFTLAPFLHGLPPRTFPNAPDSLR